LKPDTAKAFHETILVAATAIAQNRPFDRSDPELRYLNIVSQFEKK
jgi:hypothetical protein